jgi:uncharacterized membrane protein YvbJ
MNVQCPNCGHVQEFDPGYKICLNCGAAVDESHSRILKNPRKGRGMQGVAIIAFLLFFFIFLFWSKYAGGNGMAISALVYIWGIYKTYLNKKDLNENHGH